MLILHFQTWKLLSVFFWVKRTCWSSKHEKGKKSRFRGVWTCRGSRCQMSWFNLFRNSWAVGILCTQKKGWRKKIGLSEKRFSGGKGLIRWHSLEKHDQMHFWMHNMLKLWNRSPHWNQLTQLKTGNYSCSWTKLGIKRSHESWFLLQYRYFNMNSVKDENL